MTLSAAKILMFIIAILATLHFVSLAYVSAPFVTMVASGFVMSLVWVLFSQLCTKDEG